MDKKINNIRAIAIILVVIGHSIILFDPEWNVYTSSYSSDFLITLKRIINLIQMPLFFSLSGYCYYLSPWWKKSSYRMYCKKKFQRLLIPFIVVGLVYMIPIRIIARYSPYQGKDYLYAASRLFVGTDAGHLWYLPTLFLIFCIVGLGRLSRRLFNVNTRMPILLFVSLALSVASKFLPKFFYVSRALQYLFWFILGCYEYRLINNSALFKTFNNSIVRIILCIFAIVGIVMYLYIYSSDQTYFLKGIEYILGIMICHLIFFSMPLTESKALNYISMNSYGIYLFHSPLLYLVFCFCSSWIPIIVCFIGIAGCGSIALLITSLIRRNALLCPVIGEKSITEGRKM